MQHPTLNAEIQAYCKKLEQEFDNIPEHRKSKLKLLSDYIAQKIQQSQIPEVIVICTHNSRRSHIGQIWLAVASEYFGFSEIKTYSGGTEATAFNIRAVEALRRIGFDISTQEKIENTVYQVRWKEKMTPYQAFSKKYDQKPNPTKGFAAVMVCSEADEACPFVVGCDFRLTLPFEDPKKFDNTDLEIAKYSERVKQIGKEMLYVIHQATR